MIECPTCHGEPYMVRRDWTDRTRVGEGYDEIPAECPQCHDLGYLEEVDCRHCDRTVLACEAVSEDTCRECA